MSFIFYKYSFKAMLLFKKCLNQNVLIIFQGTHTLALLIFLIIMVYIKLFQKKERKKMERQSLIKNIQPSQKMNKVYAPFVMNKLSTYVIVYIMINIVKMVIYGIQIVKEI